MKTELMAVKVPLGTVTALRRKASREGRTYPGLVRAMVDRELEEITAVASSNEPQKADSLT